MTTKFFRAALPALMVLASSAVAFGETNTGAMEQMLVLTMRDGSTQRISLASNPRTTVENGTLTLATDEASMSFPLESVGTFTYEQRLSGIDSVNEDNAVTYSYEGGALTMRVRPGESVRIYGVDGRELVSTKADTTGECVVDMTAYQSGVYIVSCNNKSFKIHKR